MFVVLARPGSLVLARDDVVGDAEEGQRFVAKGLERLCCLIHEPLGLNLPSAAAAGRVVRTDRRQWSAVIRGEDGSLMTAA